MKALVYKSTGSWYLAKSEEGRFFNCRIKGRFKIDKEITSTNPIAVGDVVNIEVEDIEEESAMITTIFPRKNYIVRASPHHKKHIHIVASNLDQSLIIATIKDPRTSTGFIDRYLVTCEAYHIPAIIVFNKADTLDEEDMKHYTFLYDLYTKVGYPVYLIAAEMNQGLEQIKTILKNKVSLFTGHSGVGKSTLINKLIPDMDIRVQEVSAWSGKGLHTTTFAEMHDLIDGGQIIDTPGIRELGVVNISRQELSGYYPEMKKVLIHCKYNNCLHFNEPGCAVKDAVNQHEIDIERYANYLKIYETIEDKNY